MLDTTYSLKKVAIVSFVALFLVTASVAYYFVAHSTKIARGQGVCPVDKVCGLSPQDSAVFAGNTLIFTGKSIASSVVCGESQTIQSIVLLSGDGRQPAVLTASGAASESKPGTRVLVDNEQSNFCFDLLTQIFWKRWEGKVY